MGILKCMKLIICTVLNDVLQNQKLVFDWEVGAPRI